MRLPGKKRAKGAEEDSDVVEAEAAEVETAEAEMKPPESRGFFDLQPEEVASFKPAAAAVARRKPVNLKPFLKALAAVLLLGALVSGIVVLWPSSQAGVPDLVGSTLPEALDLARSEGFTPSVTAWEYSSRYSDGVVTDQNPAGAKAVEKGSRIKLTVSKGPAPEIGPVPGQSGTPQPGAGSTDGSPLAEKTVTIDPGHQAAPASEEWADPGITKRLPGESGAKGVVTGNDEYLVALDTGLKLKGLLEKDGINVVMTRETSSVDITNVIRAEIANNVDSDLCVRIHCGSSSDPSVMGARTLYPARTRWTGDFYEQSKTAALLIQAELVKACDIEDGGVLDNGDMPGFNWSRVPVVQPEIGYLTNPRDDSLLADEESRWAAARGLRNGIIKYLDIP